MEHAVNMPEGLEVPPEGNGKEVNGGGDDTPFESVRIFGGGKGIDPDKKKLRQWIRARGRISDLEVDGTGVVQGGPSTQDGEIDNHNHQAHLSALAYMSDSYFIGTVARVHNLERFASKRSIERTLRSFTGSDEERTAMKAYLERIADEEARENREDGTKSPDDRRIGMMVSLDHSIFFHNPRAFRADDWMLTEMESPWAGDGRGFVLQRIWGRDGKLIATCTQEGCVRLQQEKEIKL